MTHLQYNFIDSNGNLTCVRLSCEGTPDIWHIREGEFILAGISRAQEGWKQLSGENIPGSLIRGAGAFIERYFQESVPLKIKERWPRVILKVEKQADNITIVCREHVNIKTFRPIFCRFVPQLFKVELNLSMEVYNFDGSQHFTFQIGRKTLQQAKSVVTERIY